jgi:acid phosphatase
VPWLVALALAAACSAGARRMASPPAEPVPPIAPAAGATYDGLDASLWIQTAEEARLLREVAYAAAGRALGAALADPAWSAFDQGAEAAALPPAAVLDLDETVLDNSPYNAWLTVRGERFGPTSWSAWVEAAEAAAVPGALEFAQAARRLGVSLFYVSNRDAPMEAATRRNLEALGLPLDAAGDAVLLRGERPEWRSDKSPRYREVARSHRVLVLIGDDLNDFVPMPRGATPESRRALVDPLRQRFGRDWFVLPNPVHGSWQRAVLEGAGADSPAAETARKLEVLRVFEAPPLATPP